MLQFHNSLSGSKEPFEPLHPPHVGLYVCGPTVYSDAHLGNCRTFVQFDLLYRYLLHKGYEVRYVRNITDVGHLEGDADSDAEDKISKKARLQQLEPMELVHHYTRGFHDIMRSLNNLPPSIEPRATGHIVEQIEMVKTILTNGYAYEHNGSVYFDTQKLLETDIYGQLSGRKVEDLLAHTRDNLKQQDQKRHPSDFAIWIKADERHLMRWPSPWSVGFPGWHLECSAMSTKYLGKTFDIHGGGFDLKFPHHENEVAQNHGAFGCSPARYWLHSNMLLLNGKKMSKSIDPDTGVSNSISPTELFEGGNPLFEKAFSPMVLRFLMLQTHYRSTLDLSNTAMLAAEKGYQRLMETRDKLGKLDVEGASDVPTAESRQINAILDRAYADMDDDLNTPNALAKLFTVASKINSLYSGRMAMTDIDRDTLVRMQTTYDAFVNDIFGLQDATQGSTDDSDTTGDVMNVLLDLRTAARENKDWATSDQIRDALQAIGITLKDGKDGTTWKKN